MLSVICKGDQENGGLLLGNGKRIRPTQKLIVAAIWTGGLWRSRLSWTSGRYLNTELILRGAEPIRRFSWLSGAKELKTLEEWCEMHWTFDILHLASPEGTDSLPWIWNKAEFPRNLVLGSSSLAQSVEGGNTIRSDSDLKAMRARGGTCK